MYKKTLIGTQVGRTPSQQPGPDPAPGGVVCFLTQFYVMLFDDSGPILTSFLIDISDTTG